MIQQNWIDTVLKNYKERNSCVLQSDIDHIFDWLENSNEKLSIRMSFEQALEKANQWTSKINNLNEKGLTGPGKTKEVLLFDNGYKFISLVDEMSYNWEGHYMNHCVASYFGGEGKIYSLRDKNNIPHCTIELRNNSITQIKGRSNGPIKPYLVSYVIQMLAHINCTLEIKDLLNIGYILPEDYTLKILKENYKNLKTFVNDNREFVFKGNKIVLVKEHNEYSEELFMFFVEKNDIDNAVYFLNERFNISNIDSLIPRMLKIILTKGYFDFLKVLIEKGLSFQKFKDSSESYGLTPITAAISKNNLEIIKYLIEQGENINAKSSMALEAAVICKNFKILDFLFENGINIKPKSKSHIVNSFYHVIENDDIEMLNYLVNHGFDLHDIIDRRTISKIVNGNNISILKYLINNGICIEDYKEELLIEACEAGSLGIVKYLIEFHNVDYYKKKERLTLNFVNSIKYIQVEPDAEYGHEVVDETYEEVIDEPCEDDEEIEIIEEAEECAAPEEEYMQPSSDNPFARISDLIRDINRSLSGDTSFSMSYETPEEDIVEYLSLDPEVEGNEACGIACDSCEDGDTSYDVDYHNFKCAIRVAVKHSKFDVLNYILEFEESKDSKGVNVINNYLSKFIESDFLFVNEDWNLMMEVIFKIGAKYDVPCCYNIADIMKKISDFMWNEHKRNLKTMEDLHLGVYLYLKELEKGNE